MSLLDWFRRAHPETPPPPEPPKPLPTDEEIAWAKQEAAALIRRARMLDVEVELERLRMPRRGCE